MLDLNAAYGRETGFLFPSSGLATIAGRNFCSADDEPDQATQDPGNQELEIETRYTP